MIFLKTNLAKLQTYHRNCYKYLLLTNFTELEITKTLGGSCIVAHPMAPIQNFGWAVAHAAHASSAPHVLVRGVSALHTLPVASNQAL